MKKLAIISALALSGFAFNSANAQVHVSVGFNLGGPVVVQRPVAVYDDYYYLPDVDAYYSVDENLYYYNDGYDWVSAVYLPGAYRNYSWNNVRRVEIRANRPYMNHNVYRTRYNGARFDWGRYDNRNDRRDWNRNAANNRPDWNRGNDRPDWNRGNNTRPDQNRGNDNRPDWNRGNNNGPDRGGRPSQGNDNRGNDNRGGNGGFDRQQPQQPGRGDSRPQQPGRGEGRPSQNDNRARGGSDDRANFASNVATRRGLN